MGEICERFIALIEAGEYYEAHEVLENVWYPRRFEDDDEVRLIKGFINASVAFELVKKGRMRPARRTWQVFLKYRPLLQNVDTEAMIWYRRIDAILEDRYERLFGS